MSGGNAIEAEGLVKRFGEKTALAGVSFDVPRGTVCGLLGPNGAGKTTAVRILTTLSEPTAGRARVAGIDVQEQPHEVRRRLGLAAQDATVDGLLTGRENLVMIGELHHLGRRVARARAEELLEQFSLTDAGDRAVKTYSGGMRRRLDLAATLVSRPEILFLDEPTTGLDPRARNELWDVLGSLVGEGTTVMLTTQYLEEADRLADDIVVIDHGRVIARGTARELKRQVGGSQVFAVVADAARLDEVAGHVARLTGAEPGVDRATRLVHAGTDGDPRVVSTLADALAEAGVEVEEIGLRQPTLDDVFLTLTGAPIADDEPALEEVSR
ncbi:ATP-binding cassette domain-containing protein [Miltoncostaea marina]|uniref:ATP-binding cassette domain-containing protein n=1 Tax=Miltoncostaea marina TaxID=2843215 RepID=UPI001C3D8DC0|nr:ATP-binding cassette domain-containing protein [Miltoncostaea marina]